MKLESTILVLWQILRQIQCEDTTKLDYYEFKLGSKEAINYEELIDKIKAVNKTEEPTVYGTDWEDFKDNTHILIDIPKEKNINDSLTTIDRDPWNLIDAELLTFPPDNETTTMAPGSVKYTLQDLTFFTSMDWTLANEKRFYEVRDLTRDSFGEYKTKDPLDYFDDTEHDIFLKADEEFFKPFINLTSSEEKRKLYVSDFMRITITTQKSPPTTWNPFLVQSDERRELDEIAYQKRMATNRALREQVKSGNMGGLGNLFGGMIPINLGSLFGGGGAGAGGAGRPLTITLQMGGGTTTKKKTTTMGSTLSTRTFKPRPDPEDFLAWKYLEDGSPRPPMAEDVFIDILKKHGTPPPYHIPPVSIPAHINEQMVLNNMAEKVNLSEAMTVDDEQKDRIYNFLNPFIQQHTAMDLVDTEGNLEKFKAQHTIPTEQTKQTQHPFGFYNKHDVTPDQPNSTREDWKTNWSKINSQTTDPFNQENLMKALNEGAAADGAHPWKMNALRDRTTQLNTEPDPNVRYFEKDFDNMFDVEAQKKRQQQADKALQLQNEKKEKIKRMGITKPPYWKEVIGKDPTPLFDNSEQAAKDFKDNINKLASTLNQNEMFDWMNKLNNRLSSKPEEPNTWFYATPDVIITREAPSTTKNENKWTTPLEDKERLNTLLNFMFPYIQKKSELFEQGGAAVGGSSSHSPPKQSTTFNPYKTSFDPWKNNVEMIHPQDSPPEEYRNLFRPFMNKNPFESLHNTSTSTTSRS